MNYRTHLYCSDANSLDNLNACVVDAPNHEDCFSSLISQKNIKQKHQYGRVSIKGSVNYTVKLCLRGEKNMIKSLIGQWKKKKRRVHGWDEEAARGAAFHYAWRVHGIIWFLLWLVGRWLWRVEMGTGRLSAWDGYSALVKPSCTMHHVKQPAATAQSRCTPFLSLDNMGGWSKGERDKGRESDRMSPVCTVVARRRSKKLTSLQPFCLSHLSHKSEHQSESNLYQGLWHKC